MQTMKAARAAAVQRTITAVMANSIRDSEVVGAVRLMELMSRPCEVNRNCLPN